MRLKNKNSYSSNVSDSRNGSDNRFSKRINYFKSNKDFNYSRNDIKNVSRRYPCEICGKPDWCSYTISPSGEMVLAICRRQNAGSVKQSRDGAYIHVLNDTPRVTNYVKPSVEIVNPKADVTRCDAVYTSLLKRIQNSEQTKLSSNHVNNLLERGLCSGSIAQNLYGTVPDQTTGNRLAEELSKSFDLTGVPGFYKNSDDQWCLNTYHKGFYIPYKNHKGLVMGLQIRLDNPVDGNKYVWFSSAGKSLGASSGSPLHFVNTPIIQENKAVYITEGALKADVIGELKNAGVVAMAGVKSVRAEVLVQILKSLFPDTQQVFLAFDADFRTNEAVEKALSEMETEFQKWNGLEVRTLVWDINDGKGFDDYLLQERENETGKNENGK